MKTFVVLGHPQSGRFSAALAEAFSEGFRRRMDERGGELRGIDFGKLSFGPEGKAGVWGEKPLSPDLVSAQESIQWADHIVFVYPVWWGTMPGQLKTFIDRVFQPGFAASRQEKLLCVGRYAIPHLPKGEIGWHVQGDWGMKCRSVSTG